ncbi:Meiotic cell division protein Pelota/DOM34 [Pseudoloma neurophilia]|uniref:Meiotic cell division protein Pelota/DOM34 n=1 Tax=Pseudoloma neurophilia TaxID=146866 RepID=A0A0R0M2U6_9MICR|nr:Meiotic cell division protein Pelota/DOM34 [Pseudoloma neurophilia]
MGKFTFGSFFKCFLVKKLFFKKKQIKSRNLSPFVEFSLLSGTLKILSGSPYMLIDYIKKEDQTIKITANHPADIHILYQLIDEKTQVTMFTSRKVEIGNQKTRISVKLTLQICETSADFENNALNLRGRIQNEVENIKLGSFHNLTIGLNESFVLHVQDLRTTVDKLLKHLDVFLLIVFRNGKFEVAAIDEFGLRNRGHFKQKEFKQFLTEACSEVVTKQPAPFPLKSSIKVKYIVTNHQIENIVKISQPIHKFELTKTDEKLNLLQIFDRLLQNPQNSSIPFMKDLVIANNFLLMYEKGHTERIALGLTEILEAQDHFAIQTLIVTNKLYCSFDIEEREKIRNLISSMKKNIIVAIISDFHRCGVKLNEIGGIGAILTYDYRKDDH